MELDPSDAPGPSAADPNGVLSICCSLKHIPRYLLRVQVPSSVDFIDTKRAEARPHHPLPNARPEVPADMLLRHITTGDSTKSNFVSFTSSLMWAIAHAYKISEIGGRAPLNEEDIEIFVLDTQSLRDGNFIKAWPPFEYQEHGCDYLLHESLDVRGHCSKTTLAELNSLGLQVICRPYHTTPSFLEVSSNSWARQRNVLETLQRLKAMRRRQYVFPYPEGQILEAAVNLAKVFPAELEVPMMVMFLGLCLPPPAEKVLQRIQYEFGGDLILSSLWELGYTEMDKDIPEIATFWDLATNICQTKHDQEMGDMMDFMRDVPFHEGSDRL